MPETTATEPPARIEDLAMLVTMLARKLRRAEPTSDLPGRATDYLCRKGLQGSPLRDEATFIVRPSAADVMREALRELETSEPSAKGMDPASRAALYRAELERRRLRARRALDDAARAEA